MAIGKPVAFEANAEDRLTDLALELGLLSDRARELLKARREFVRGYTALLKKTSLFVKDRGLRLMAAAGIFCWAAAA